MRVVPLEGVLLQHEHLQRHLLVLEVPREPAVHFAVRRQQQVGRSGGLPIHQQVGAVLCNCTRGSGRRRLALRLRADEHLQPAEERALVEELEAAWRSSSPRYGHIHTELHIDIRIVSITHFIIVRNSCQGCVPILQWQQLRRGSTRQ